MMEVLLIALLFIIGGCTSYFAAQRGRDPLCWFALGFLFGFLGLILLFILPKKLEEPNKKIEPVSQEPLKPQLATDWFYMDSNYEQKGPLLLSALKRIWQNNDLTPDTLVWSESMPEWKPIAEIPHLESELKGV